VVDLYVYVISRARERTQELPSYLVDSSTQQLSLTQQLTYMLNKLSQDKPRSESSKSVRSIERRLSPCMLSPTSVSCKARTQHTACCSIRRRRRWMRFYHGSELIGYAGLTVSEISATSVLSRLYSRLTTFYAMFFVVCQKRGVWSLIIIWSINILYTSTEC
jgi:hypothetical protein